MFRRSASPSPALPPPTRVLSLADYVWGAERERSLAPSRADGLLPGRVVRAERGLRDVVTEAGNLHSVIVSPTVAGDGPSPCTGDRVAVRPSDAAASATIADEGLERTFAGISEPARDCRFADRARTSEPRCAGVPAVEDGRLPRRRLDSYHRLQRENAHAAARTDARLRAETKRQGGQGARLRRAVKQSPNSKA